jgi:hypothetical protein
MITVIIHMMGMMPIIVQRSTEVIVFFILNNMKVMPMIPITITTIKETTLPSPLDFILGLLQNHCMLLIIMNRCRGQSRPAAILSISSLKYYNSAADAATYV